MATVVKKPISKASQNGKAKNLEVVTSNTKVNEILNPSAENRIKKLENFNLLVERHKFLVKKKDELDKFIISSDGSKEKIILENAQGYKFEVSNSQVIEKVTELMSKELNVFTDHSTKQVLEFNL